MHIQSDTVHTHRWTVADYHKMAEVGLLAEDTPVELINGEIVEMVPIGSRHSSKVKQLIDLLSLPLHDKAILSVQDPIRLGEHSEPEPDIAILRRKQDYYASAHPTSQDVLLLLEVSDTTTRYDREVKIPLYACHGIPEVWLLDLQQQCLEIYLSPEQGKYQQMHRLLSGQASPAAFPDIIIQLSELFPQQD